ncbi:MAG: hypothetical protein IKH03_02855 [Oscillospiraceae bacterium]|nr:hypothetical protein [Oscillospiraceae bacterium]
MKQSKKTAALLLALVLLLGLAACGEGTKPSETPNPAHSPAPTDGLYVTVTGASAGSERPADADGAAEYGVYAAASMPAGAAKDAPEAVLSEAEAPAPMPKPGEAALLPEPTGAPESGLLPDPDLPPAPPDPGEAFVLTAAEWNDNANWPFFTNLVNAGKLAFPSFGLDPRQRVKVTLRDAAGQPLPGERVELLDASGETLWTAQTDRDGAAYLFCRSGETPAAVSVQGRVTPLSLETPPEDQQGDRLVTVLEELELTAAPVSAPKTALQVMFLVDTTGSMSDELSYLQKDFSAIAGEIGDAAAWSVCFYRDEGDDYVTKLSEFSRDTAAIQDLIAGEYAAGGGDTPEAVAEILDQTLDMGFLQEAGRSGWREDCEKLAFLIFDAPPHAGRDETLQNAVRRAAEAGIRLVPVVASNAERDTELFARALAICTGGTYVFLTDDSGVGESHLEPIVGPYTVEKLHDILVRIIRDSLPA